MIGIVAGLLVAFLVFTAGFYSGSSITGNYFLDFFRSSVSKPIQTVQSQQLVEQLTPFMNINAKVCCNISVNPGPPWNTYGYYTENECLYPPEGYSRFGVVDNTFCQDVCCQLKDETTKTVSPYDLEKVCFSNLGARIRDMSFCKPAPPLTAQSEKGFVGLVTSRRPACIYVGPYYEISGKGIGSRTQVTAILGVGVKPNTQDVCASFNYKEENDEIIHYVPVYYTLKSFVNYYSDASCGSLVSNDISDVDYMLDENSPNVGLFTNVSSASSACKLTSLGSGSFKENLYNTGVMCCKSEFELPDNLII